MTAEEAAIDTAAAQERLKGILGTQPPAAANGTPTGQRKCRSDAGKAKPKKAEPSKRAFLTEEQAARIDKLSDAWFRAIEENSKAENRMLDAERDYRAYLDELQGK